MSDRDPNSELSEGNIVMLADRLRTIFNDGALREAQYMRGRMIAFNDEAGERLWSAVVETLVHSRRMG